MKFDIKKLFINPYVISFGVVIILIIALLWGTLGWIDSYTNHGEQIVVPDVTDLTREEAENIFKDNNLKGVVIDSVFMKGKKLGVVVEQIPEAGSFVKEERTIYIITNSNSIRKIVLPDVREISLRQAESTINSVGLKVDSIEYVPSNFKDLVKDVKCGGNIVAPGSRIAEGSKVTLLVGCGDANEELIVPSFRALNPFQAISKAHSAYLNIGEVYYDVTPKDEKDKEAYFVYKQSPITGSTIKFGETVNIYLTKDPTSLEVPEEVFTQPDETKSEDNNKEGNEDLFK